MRLGRSGEAGAGWPACASTRCTVSRCTCSWRAMVPTRHFSAVVQAQDLRAQIGRDDQRTPSGAGSTTRAGQREARPWRRKPWRTQGDSAAAQRRQRATIGAGLASDTDARALVGLLKCGQWSIGGRQRGTLMRHEVGGAGVQRGRAAGPVALAAALAPAARARGMRHAAGTAALVAPGGLASRVWRAAREQARPQ